MRGRWRQDLPPWTWWTGIGGAALHLALLVSDTNWPLRDPQQRGLWFFVYVPLAIASGALLYGVWPGWLRNRSARYKTLGVPGPGRTIVTGLLTLVFLAGALGSAIQANRAVVDLRDEMDARRREDLGAITAAVTETEQAARRRLQDLEAEMAGVRLELRIAAASATDYLDAEIESLRGCIRSILRNRTTLTVSTGYSTRRVTLLEAPLLTSCSYY